MKRHHSDDNEVTANLQKKPRMTLTKGDIINYNLLCANRTQLLSVSNLMRRFSNQKNLKHFVCA